MKNPFKRFHTKESKPVDSPPVEKEPEPIQPPPAPIEAPPAEPPEDRFTEWCRSQVRGGIERRERNDIFEAYSVYGTDEAGRLACRFYHRYPEHEKDFDLSYTRALSFDEFNRRLLSELDKGDLKLSEYHDCIQKAAALSQMTSSEADYQGFTDAELNVLQAFCDAIDTLKDKRYLHGDGIFSCECESIVGSESLNIRFRKPLPHDALSREIAGVSKKEVAGYDIDDMWILGVYNRLRERCSGCGVIQLTSEWSLEKESVLLISAEGFSGIDGTLLVAIAESSMFRRFGFYSLDFSNK